MPGWILLTLIYFGSTLSRDGLLDAEIYSCISKASVAFGKLEKKDWADSDIPINKKIGVCRTCVILILVYLAETWTTHRISWTLPSKMCQTYTEQKMADLHTRYNHALKSWVPKHWILHYAGCYPEILGRWSFKGIGKNVNGSWLSQCAKCIPNIGVCGALKLPDKLQGQNLCLGPGSKPQLS